MRRSDLLPPALTRWLLRTLGRDTLRGDYPDWRAAAAASAPYETDLKIYAQLAEDIRAGRHTSSRLLSPLLAAMLLAGERTRILDFGGNLGHVYFDVARLAGNCINTWSIVDLPDIVALGNERFADDKLHFFPTIESAVSRGNPDLVLLFHVLQYLESPFEYLARIISLAPRLIVLHEFPVGNRERFLVQHLLPELGRGTRPARIFSDAQVSAAFTGYDLIEEIVLPAWDRTLVDARQVARIYRHRTMVAPSP